MMGGQSKTPARGQAQPGQDGRLATAAGTFKLAHHKGRAKAGERYLVQPKGIEPFTVYAKGRYVLRARVVKGGAV